MASTQNYFGSNAGIFAGDALPVRNTNDLYLIINQSDFLADGWQKLSNDANGLLLANITAKWVTAILLHLQDYTENMEFANTIDSRLSVSPPTVGLEMRNNVLMRRYSFTVDIYEFDLGSPTPDPDTV